MDPKEIDSEHGFDLDERDPMHKNDHVRVSLFQTNKLKLHCDSYVSLFSSLGPLRGSFC